MILVPKHTLDIQIASRYAPTQACNWWGGGPHFAGQLAEHAVTEKSLLLMMSKFT